MDRRRFIRNAAITSAIIPASSFAASGLIMHPSQRIMRSNPYYLNRCKKPLAIAMWDYSWILRHHRYGEFENWDQVLEGLAERGYNAIRMDAMPQYVAADTDGKITDDFRSVRKIWRPMKWGNEYSMNFNPREALLEFLPKCKKYGIKVGLATWFMAQGGTRGIFTEEGGLLRAWNETLDFLKKNGLLDDNIIYIDLLNEYPVAHGYDWLKKELDARGDVKQFKLNNPDANVPDDIDAPTKDKFNSLQKEFYNEFANNLICSLKTSHPEYPLHFSLTGGMQLDQIDLSKFEALDYHRWFSNSGKLPYVSQFRNIDQAKDYRPIYQDFLKGWEQNKTMLINWMDDTMNSVSQLARKYNIPCGNTEGWGAVFWQDHPDIDWRFIQESAEICVDLAKKYDNYKFICTSNFTEPQFKGMWEDVKWHRKITARIKG